MVASRVALEAFLAMRSAATAAKLARNTAKIADELIATRGEEAMSGSLLGGVLRAAAVPSVSTASAAKMHLAAEVVDLQMGAST